MYQVLHRVFTVCLAAMFILSVTSAVALEHRTRSRARHSRSHRSDDNTLLSINVRPGFITFSKGDRVTIRCGAKGGTRVQDMPFITFYREFGENAIMPLSSSSYGVSIETSTPHKKHRGKKFVSRTVRLLHLEKETYNVLNPGNNRFFCRAAKLDGSSTTEAIIVRKN